MATYVDALLSSRQTFMRHVEAELTDDLDATMSSVSSRPTYALAQRAPAIGSARMLTIEGHERVRAFYAEQAEVVGPVALRVLTNVASDWYEFVENVPTRGFRPGGATASVNSVTLIPMASADQIQGEFLWERTAAADVPFQPGTPESLAASSAIPMTRLRNAKAHEDLLDNLRHGDVDALMRQLVVEPLWAARGYATGSDAALVAAEGGADVRELLTAWTSTFDIHHVSVLTRIATDWYVFADELYTVTVKAGPLAGELREFRNAMFYPVSGDGLVEGAMGYGTALVEPSTQSSDEVGRVTYTAPGYVDPLRDLPSQGGRP